MALIPLQLLIALQVKLWYRTQSLNENVLKWRSLHYHEFPTPGNLSVHVTKLTNSQDYLSLAYTPGADEPVIAIVKNLEGVYRYTAKGNLVAVMFNGTAVLGLGDVGTRLRKRVPKAVANAAITTGVSRKTQFL